MSVPICPKCGSAAVRPTGRKRGNKLAYQCARCGCTMLRHRFTEREPQEVDYSDHYARKTGAYLSERTIKLSDET